LAGLTATRRSPLPTIRVAATRESLLQRAAIGAVAGFVATAPMTSVMLALSRKLQGETDPLPPEVVTERVTQRAGLDDEVRGLRMPVFLTSHFGFGAVAGALYYALLEPGLRWLPVRGQLYGMLVWLLSYAGWLPALNLFPDPAHTSRRRTVQLILAHLAWGSSLQSGAALLEQRLNQDR
jgi:uncharacterized membrane protein YagU involved in acid resistance